MTSEYFNPHDLIDRIYLLNGNLINVITFGIYLRPSLTLYSIKIGKQIQGYFFNFTINGINFLLCSDRLKFPL